MEQKHTISGILHLIGAALSAYLLVWYGAWALIAALVGTALGNMAPPEQPRAVNLVGLAILGALMASAGFCLALGFLILGFRAFCGGPFPRWRSTRIYLLSALIPIGLTVALAWFVAATASAPVGYQDLVGIWHPIDSDKHTYRFNPDGTLDSWWSNLPHGTMGRWSRTGNTVTVIYDRNWQMTGTIGRGSFKGTKTDTSSGKPLGAEEWVRDGT
ncbi:hypothetical protein P12x_002973 [Tundrisphaera lichenicola]|uniref:hypothetical protein n=1 Tax=Tundrisphaera lichenicola TaxID=2029860 RepID=UPI003EBA485D